MPRQSRSSRISRPDPAAPLVCQQLVEMVSDYLDGALSAADRGRIEAHLEGCDGCTAYVEQVRELLRLTAGVETGEQLPARTMDRLKARFAARHPPAG